jgi:hypothetical protein
MLVATRDPMHSPGAHDPSSPRRDGVHGHVPAPRSARFVTMLQMAGSLLAIPVALGSAYSVYQANFSPDTQCQQLRANIIAMIDKKIDAATRRMLVRRDVEAFEKSCGGFDPDAKAAFVTLLAIQPLKVPGHAATPKADVPKAEVVKAEPAKAEAAKPDVVKTETPAKDAARKAEPRATAKPAAVAVAEPEAVSDTAASDARWLDAVRGALVTHDAARDAAAANEAARAPVLKSTLTPAPFGALPATAAPVTAAPVAAPALPPAAAVATQPPRDANHPVPPAAIPDAPPLDIASAAAGRPRSTWISNIPFVGQVLDK